MADNIDVTAGSGTTIAADEVSGVLHQRVKISVGADGTAADADSDKGNASAATLRVAIASDDVNASRILTTTGPAAPGSTPAPTTAFVVAGKYNSSGVTFANGDVGSLQMSASGRLLIANDALPAGSNVIGKVSIDQTTSGTTNAVVPLATENHLGEVGGKTARPSANFTRPNDTTAYASGDLVANNTTNTSVTAMSWSVSRVTGKGGMIRRVRLRKSGASVTNALFRLHLYHAAPSTITNGDNGVFSTSGVADYLGAFDITVDRAFTDGAAGNGMPLIGSEINFTADTVYGLLEARGAYTPAAQEVFTVDLELLQN